MEILLEKQHERCKKLRETNDNNATVENALSYASMALEDFKSHTLAKVFEYFSKSILDLTYFLENQMTEGAFNPESVFLQLNEILGLMTQCGQLLEKHLNKVPSEKELINHLTLDVVECIHWRVGALFYMYCHTVRDNPQRLEREHTMLLKCCCIGVCHLQKMATIRTPLSDDEDVVSHDATVTELLRKGIFSDVHMLSLMYAGEMCYWYWQENMKLTSDEAVNNVSSSNEAATSPGAGATASLEPNPSQVSIVVTCLCGEQFTSDWEKLFDAPQFGQACLSKYIEVARGPLKEHGWKYDAAVKMIVEMKKNIT